MQRNEVMRGTHHAFVCDPSGGLAGLDSKDSFRRGINIFSGALRFLSAHR